MLSSEIFQSSERLSLHVSGRCCRARKEPGKGSWCCPARSFRARKDSVYTCPGDTAELGRNPVKKADVVRRDLFRARTNSVSACPGDAAELGKNPVKEADVIRGDPDAGPGQVNWPEPVVNVRTPLHIHTWKIILKKIRKIDLSKCHFLKNSMTALKASFENDKTFRGHRAQVFCYSCYYKN